MNFALPRKITRNILSVSLQNLLLVGNSQTVDIIIEECTEEPANLPEHSRPLPEVYEKAFRSEVTLSCEYGYKGSEVLEMTCAKKEEGVLKWEVCGTCACMLNELKIPFLGVLR